MKKSGFTLIELLVAIALFSIVVAIATDGFVNALRTQRQVASLISTESNVTLVLEQMAREVRTGYLFCHDDDVNNADANGSPSSACADPTTGEQCTITDSGQLADPGTPSADIYSENGKGDLAEWNCPAIDYYNAQAAHVNYSLQGGALMKSDSSAADPTAQSITGGDVSVKYLHFILFGNLEDDHWTPRITISIGVAPSSTDPAVSGDVLNLQTTVSARQIDCDASGNC
jgi:prepilin-type N-terminal cleavage/methylation domain-containing protein